MKLLLLLSTLALAGCPASHGGYPTRDCKMPSDCFAGEACVDHQCVPAAGDAGGDLTTTPDATGDAR